MGKSAVVIYDNDGMLMRGGRFSEKYMQEFGVDKTIMDPFFDGPFKKCLVGQADLKEELGKVMETWRWRGTVDELLTYWFSIGAELHQNVYDSIPKLKAQGAVVCLATNQDKYRTEFLISKFKYDKLFHEIFSSASLGAYKHSPKGLKGILQTLGRKYGVTNPGQVVYWDDREDQITQLNEFGFVAQHYKDYDSFKATMTKFGYLL